MQFTRNSILLDRDPRQGRTDLGQQLLKKQEGRKPQEIVVSIKNDPANSESIFFRPAHPVFVAVTAGTTKLKLSQVTMSGNT